MKAKKSRVILSGVSLLLVLCLLVGGTMAWFTDTEKVDTNFTAGILDVSVKPGEEGQTALKRTKGISRLRTCARCCTRTSTRNWTKTNGTTT